MRMTIGAANSWNHFVRWLAGQSDQQEWAREAGEQFSRAATKRLMAGIGEQEFTEQVWPQLLKLREPESEVQHVWQLVVADVSHEVQSLAMQDLADDQLQLIARAANDLHEYARVEQDERMRSDENGGKR